MKITDQNLAANTHSPETLSKDMFRNGMKVTYVGMVVNALLIVLKFIGGIVGNSSAMIADSVHSLSDFLTDIGVIIGLRFLSKPADSDHAYGHGRIETMISLLIGIVIIITGIGLFKNAVQNIVFTFGCSFLKPPGYIALVMGVISLLSK